MRALCDVCLRVFGLASAGQSWSAVEYSSQQDYEAGALKALLGIGDTNDTATYFDFDCPPGDMLAGLAVSTCSWLGQAGAVFCQLQFSCTHRCVRRGACLTYMWQSAMLAAVHWQAQFLPLLAGGRNLRTGRKRWTSGGPVKKPTANASSLHTCTRVIRC